eukprot:ctg_327.g167
MAHNKSEIEKDVMDQIESMAKRGFRALGIALAEVPSGDPEGPPGPWTMTGLMPIFDPPRHDTKETIEKAIHMGVQVKMVTGDQLAIAKETARRLGLGTNIFTSDVLNLSDGRASIEYGGSVGELVENADGFAGVFPEHKYRIVEVLQKRGHLVGMTGDGVNDAPALKKAQVGIAVADATDAARGASDLPPDLSAHEELLDVRLLGDGAYCGDVLDLDVGVEVQHAAVHDPDPGLPQRRHHHEHQQGPRQAESAPGQVESARRVHHRLVTGHMADGEHRHLLRDAGGDQLLERRLPPQHHLAHHPQQQRVHPAFDHLLAGEHHRAGADLRNPLVLVLLHGPAGRSADVRVRRRAAGGHVHLGVRQLGLHTDRGYRLGLGGGRVGMEHRMVPDVRHHQDCGAVDHSEGQDGAVQDTEPVCVAPHVPLRCAHARPRKQRRADDESGGGPTARLRAPIHGGISCVVATERAQLRLRRRSQMAKRERWTKMGEDERMCTAAVRMAVVRVSMTEKTIGSGTL